MKRLLPLCALLCATLPAFAFVDSNNNGLSDLWERTYNNGQLYGPSFDPQADADGDGWTNAQEAAAGTNPLDPNPPEGIVRPQLTNIPAVWSEPDENGDSVIVTPASMFMEWQTIPGKQYTLLYSPDLIEWLAVPNETFIGSGSIKGYGVELTDDKLFWRVKIDDVDSDGDGLTDAEEYILGTDPTLADSDEDGMPDAWEVKWGLNPLDPADAAADADGDHVSNLREYELGTVPTGIYRIEVLPIGGFPYFHSAADDGSVVVQALLDPSSALALVTAPDANGDRELVDPAPAGNWHDLETIMADLVEGGTLEENDTLDPSGPNSSDGTFRVYQSSTDLLILQEPGVFVGTLASDVSWQAINNHGVAAATAERLVAAANGIPEHYEGDVLISDGVTTTATPMPGDWFPTSALPWVQAFSDEGKVLVCRPMTPPARPETYLLDVATGAYTFVRQPGLGGESIVCLSSRNGHMLGSGPTPFQVTTDGTPIRLEGLQIKSSPTAELVSLTSLYPNTFVPHHISSDGRITLTTTDSGNQIAILQLVPYNDTANTGMSNDWIASEIAALVALDPTRWGYLATAGTLDPDTCYWDDRWTAIQSYRLRLSSFSRQLSRFSDADGDGVVDVDDADPFDPVVDWKPAPEASYAVIVMAQVNYNGLSNIEPAVTGSSITASIGRTGTVLWNDKFKEGSGPWQDRCRIWKAGVWSGDIRKTPSTFAGCMLETEEGMVAATPYHPETSDIADVFPHAVSGDSVVGWGTYSGNECLAAWPVATLWNIVTQSGTSTWNATPVAPPPMDVSMYENPYASDDAWLFGGYRAIASPGGALAVLGGDLPLADQRKWKIWIPPDAPNVNSPSWEKSYKADGNIFKITAVEDGGSVVGQRYSGPYQYDRCLIAIDSGVEEELPESAGWLADVNALCRVNRDIYARSRLVAAGTNLWVKKESQWSITTHSPTVSPVLAVAENGILLGGHSIWRNGQEILLDDLVANLKVNNTPRYTNLRAYAMNGDGAIVALANDASNSGEGNKALLLLAPIEIRDIKDISDTEDDVIIEPRKTSNDTNVKSIAWIEPHKKLIDENPAVYDAGDDPRMPQLEVQLKGLSASVKVEWKFKCKFARPSGRELLEDEVKLPYPDFLADVSIVLAGNEPWKIHQEYESLPFFGGDAEITYKITDAEGGLIMPAQTDKFRIGGRSPDNSRARLYLTDEQPDIWFAYAICKHETAEFRYQDIITRKVSYYNQFTGNPKGKTLLYSQQSRSFFLKYGEPSWNWDFSDTKPGGYGAFQVTGWMGNALGNVPRDVIWNWKRNFEEGVDEIRREKARDATSYFNAVKTRYGANIANPPTVHTGKIRDLTAWEASVIVRYNGCGGLDYHPDLNGLDDTRDPWTYLNNSNTWSGPKANQQNYLNLVIPELE